MRKKRSAEKKNVSELTRDDSRDGEILPVVFSDGGSNLGLSFFLRSF